jgi:hypothetical protein
MNTMTEDDRILEDVVAQLRATFGDDVHLVEQGGGVLTLRIGSAEDANVGIRVVNAGRPQFAVSYPKLTIKKDGERHVRVVGADHVLLEGITWIVGQLARFGVVRPEFE